jgi:hypothetical protein
MPSRCLGDAIAPCDIDHWTLTLSVMKAGL